MSQAAKRRAPTNAGNADATATTETGAVMFANRRLRRGPAVQRATGAGWTLLFTVAGRACYRDASGASCGAEPGDLILLACGSAAEGGVLPGEEWDAFGLRFVPWLGWQPVEFNVVGGGLYRMHVVRPGHRQLIHEAWEAIIANLDALETARILRTSQEQVAQHARYERIQNELLLLKLREIFIVAERDSTTSPQLDARIREALELMERDIAAPHEMRELASRAGLSYGRFAHLFKEQLGASPRQVQLKIRLRRGAVQLEYSDDPIGAIGERIGFRTIFDFSRAFRREYGTSPSAYRALRR